MKKRNSMDKENEKIKCFLIFLDGKKEGSYIHELKVQDINIETPNTLGIPPLIQLQKPYKHDITIRVPAFDKKGKPNVRMLYTERQREILEYSEFGIVYGDFTETQAQYLKREKKELMKLIKR